MRLDPFLTTSADTLSASSGAPVVARIDFSAGEASMAYALLVSGSGTGPSTVGGIEVPLTSDAILQGMLLGWRPPFLRNAFGTLDARGDARAVYGRAPALAGQVGRTYHAAAVSYDPVTLAARRCSVARPLKILP